MQDSNPLLNSIKSMTPTPMPSEFNTISYRLDAVEKNLQHLSGQLSLYVPQRENELQLNRIQDSVRDIKDDVAEIRRQLNDLSNRIISQESEVQKRDAAQRERQDKQQIRILLWVVTTVIGVGIAVLVGYITHFFH
jgi:hypothetical protein